MRPGRRKLSNIDRGFAKNHMISDNLNHQPEESVDLVLPVAEVTALNKVVGLLSPSTGGVVQLEGPQEVRGILEVGANSKDLVDEILHADDSHLAELSLDDVVGGDGGTVSINLDKSTLVDEVTDRLEVGASVGDVGLTDSEHVLGGLVDLDEDSIVDLSQPEELKDLLDLGGHLVDTTDPHDKDQLGLSGNIIVALLLGITLQPDLVSLLILVLLGVSLGPLEYLNTLLPLVDLSLDGELSPVGSVLCLPLATLEDSLWDCGELCVGHLLL